MKNLQDATEMICDLKGSVLALDALLTALLHGMPVDARSSLCGQFDRHAELARTVLLNTQISDYTIAGFDRDVARFAALLRAA